MEQKLDITKLSKVDKILFLELMKGFVGHKEGLYRGYCGLCYALLMVSDLCIGGHQVLDVEQGLKHLGLFRHRFSKTFWYHLDEEGTIERLALIDKAIEKLKSK